ncbi:cyclic nucleotide-binding domain-containing protein [Streptomyces sp. NPDC059070]|uniref:cyclic nucleotide-binding domain-containing protein n=1 Tax=unclassified Streptomyces TaxID=2593676 RepID=UPI0034E2F9C1
MSTPALPRLTSALPEEHRSRLTGLAREVEFAADTRLFNEGGHADRFWVLRSGTVTLDMRIPGRRPAVIETLCSDELVGWSWLFRPYVWQLGAQAKTPVHAYEFDAPLVRDLMAADPVFASAVGGWVGRVLAHRLHASRVRLLDLYGPYGSGSGV